MVIVLVAHAVVLLGLQLAVVGSTGHRLVPWTGVLWTGVLGGYVALASAACFVAWQRDGRQRERTEQVLNATGEAIYGIDRGGRITFANHAMERLTGRSAADLAGADHHTVLGHADADGRPHPGEGCPVCGHIAMADGRSRDDQLFIRDDGQRVPVEYASHPVPSGDRAGGQSVVVTFRDITGRRAFERELNRQALHDPLTGLPNRTLLLDRLGLALAALRSQPYMVSVIVCNVDGFKRINHSFGHDVGDRLLTQIADRLRVTVRPEDTVARLSGDEFVVCCPAVANEATAVRVAERLRQVFAASFDIGPVTVDLEASIGIATTGDPDLSSTGLIRQAGEALREARLAGGVVRTYEHAAAGRVDGEVPLEEDLRGALAGGQLEVHYQPTIALADDRVLSVEALLRWNHPHHGVVEPATFVPVAERSGLIVPIGRWVLGEACRRIVEWNADRPVPLTVGVNVSGRQLHDARFPDEVAAVLAATGCRPEWLLLEITESVLAATVEAAAPTLQRLRDGGVHICLDDFGTGYSSLTYLRRLPVDVLKIDRSYVTHVGRRPDQRSLVSAVVNMARSLSMRTIAEGVERESDRAALALIGCDAVQGRLYTGPLPASRVELLLPTPHATLRPTAHPVGR